MTQLRLELVNNAQKTLESVHEEKGEKYFESLLKKIIKSKMNKKEFHYMYSNSGSEYSWKFEIQSKFGRLFFNSHPPFKNGYCNLGCGYRFLENYVNADFFQFNKIRTILKNPN